MAQLEEEREKQPERFRECFEPRWEHDVEQNVYMLTGEEKRRILEAVRAPLPTEHTPEVEFVDGEPEGQIIATYDVGRMFADMTCQR